MKKITLTLLTFVCALCCAFGLAACKNDNSAKIDCLYVTDGTNNDFADSSSYGYHIEIEYGEVLDLTKYKLFLHYTNSDTKEVSRTDEKLSVKYYYLPFRKADDDKQEITALPDDMYGGSYTIEYVYDGKAELQTTVNIIVSQAQSGNFTVQPTLTTWKSEGTRSKVIVRNPKGAEVKNEWITEDFGNGGTGSFPKPIEKTNDTDGHYTLYLFEKSVYDGFTETQKKDYQFLYDYWANDLNNENEHKVYSYHNEDDNFVKASAGEYMLLAVIDETYNYWHIVTSAVKITVTAPSGQ